MFVDPSRVRDLEYLKAELARPINVEPLVNQDFSYEDAYKAEVTRKKTIRRNIDKILAQLKDPHLAKLRERLTRAYFAEDKLETWKLTNQIKDYLGEELLEEGTM